MKDKEISSLEHTSWRCQYHIVFATKVQKDGDIWTDKARYRGDIEEIVSAKGEEIIEARACPDHIRNQLVSDQIADQIGLKEFVDPFTGRENKKA